MEDVWLKFQKNQALLRRYSKEEEQRATKRMLFILAIQMQTCGASGACLQSGGSTLSASFNKQGF